MRGRLSLIRPLSATGGLRILGRVTALLQHAGILPRGVGI
jgi:hypothetical protein